MSTDSDRDFFSVVLRQRACRSFTDEPVDDATMAQLLDAAVHAPSAENRQPWVFVVVRDAGVRERIGELMVRAWEDGGRKWSESRISAGMLADVHQGMHGGIAGAPVLVVVCADTQRTLEVTVASSAFPAVQNLLLAATALGLGSALTTIATGYAAELRELCALAPHEVPVAVIPIGHPAKPLGPPRRDPPRTRTI